MFTIRCDECGDEVYGWWASVVVQECEDHGWRLSRTLGDMCSECRR